MSTKPHPWPFPTPDANLVPPTADDLRWLADLGVVLLDELDPPVSDELVAYCLEWARRQELERAIVVALADAQESPEMPGPGYDAQTRPVRRLDP